MSRVNFGANPLLYPMPVMIIGTYDENGTPSAMTAAWCTIIGPHRIAISLSEHKTCINLMGRGAFTVSMATEQTVVACDYVGIVSAADVPDKFAKAGFTDTKSEFVDAPLINELPMALECRVLSFQEGILIGEIVNVNADESILTEGIIDPKKLKPITYDPFNNTYIGLGEIVGTAYEDGKKLQ